MLLFEKRKVYNENFQFPPCVDGGTRIGYSGQGGSQRGHWYNPISNLEVKIPRVFLVFGHYIVNSAASLKSVFTNFRSIRGFLK